MNGPPLGSCVLPAELWCPIIESRSWDAFLDALRGFRESSVLILLLWFSFPVWVLGPGVTAVRLSAAGESLRGLVPRYLGRNAGVLAKRSVAALTGLASLSPYGES